MYNYDYSIQRVSVQWPEAKFLCIDANVPAQTPHRLLEKTSVLKPFQSKV